MNGGHDTQHNNTDHDYQKYDTQHTIMLCVVILVGIRPSVVIHIVAYAQCYQPLYAECSYAERNDVVCLGSVC